MNFHQDKYFSPGNWWLKIRQTILALIMWLVVFSPILFIYLLYSSKLELSLEYHYLMRLLHIFLIAILCTLLLGLVLCWHNNYLLSKQRALKVRYNMHKSDSHYERLNEFYKHYFGSKQDRHNARSLTIPEEMNFDENFFEDLLSED